MEQAAEPNFISTLGLNWKLFLAQAVNFGIVIFILWRWVMKPVVGALEARRIRIEESVKQAENIEKRMNEIKVFAQDAERKARRNADALINKALASADQMKSETFESARHEAEKILAGARMTINAEKGRALAEISEETANLAVMLAKKILREKLDQRKDMKLAKDALRNL